MNNACKLCAIAESPEDQKFCPNCKDKEEARIKVIFDEKITPIIGLIFPVLLPTILVWQFHNAPEELRALSINGGDEDWLVYIPVECKPEYLPAWVERLDVAGAPDEFHLPNGDVVYIGSHA